MTLRLLLAAAAITLVFSEPISAQVKADSTKTQIVFLGTGGPSPNPNKSGAAVAIVVNGSSYIVDAGPGLVRRAIQASRLGVNGLAAPKLRRVFITHHHSDHTLGLPDLMYTPWVVHRTVPLDVYGPPGIAAMVHHIAEAYAEDNDIRINGLERNTKPGSVINAHEIKAGVVYKDANITVTAFPVPHGSWKYAFGYRFVTHDRTIVVSGDTSPTDAISSACNGCDVLLHEVYTVQGYAQSDTAWRSYLRSFHTSTQQLANVATKARPGLLILYHQMWFGDSTDTEASMLSEMHKFYKGKVASAHDLDIF
ncbi:MAG: MBL fold metallo-hydrolase [Gemmatimonadaceae bacterium]|nr:MBL fold metallo-hydrolase [Gemmatimonadaceae bacterium]